MSALKKSLKNLLGTLEKAACLAEDTILVLILSSMIGLAAGQILLRNVFDFSFYWSDELLRLLVLWLALAGAIAASRKDKHISISVLEHVLSAKLMRISGLLVNLFTAGVCGLVTWHSTIFVNASREFGDVLLGNTPAWILQLILPLGFGIIAYRYGLFFLRDLFQLVRGENPP